MPAAYDDVKRDPRSRAFYNSAAWKRVRLAQLSRVPWCEYVAPGARGPCGNRAQHVHHVDPIAGSTGWAKRLDPAGLMSVCIGCHNRAEAVGPALPHVAGTLDLAEDGTYAFDAEAADRPVRFIKRFCRHYEGRHAGKPFELHPVQDKIVRDVYGWRDRATGFRRFTQVWFEAGAGAGKSPLLASLGLYGLMADHEPAAQVYSLASNYGQARVVFDTAKRFIDQAPELAALLHVTQYEIAHPASRSYWRIISGKGPKAGFRPSLCVGDECHEWVSREAYDSIQSRMTKRDSPIFWIATNAGENRHSLCWQLHEEAVGVLSGRRTNPKLYPIVWAARPDARVDDPDAWRDANQLLGTTIDPAKVAEECERAKGEPALEARFRRLYLSQWVQGANKWLDIEGWDANVAPFDAADLADVPLYIGLDLSQGDDLCAAVYVWVGPDRMHVDAHFWVPRATAEHYEKKDSIPYGRWAEAGAITLLDEVTVSAAVRLRIADEVIAASARGKVQAVCYDRYKSDDCTARIEAAGVKCVPVAQGYSVSPGCNELDRRLKERSITIAPNPVLRANAEVVEVKFDDRGNFWPVKPNARGGYKGRRSAKIDGIAALVTALTEARKHHFPASAKRWRGSMVLVGGEDS